MVRHPPGLPPSNQARPGQTTRCSPTCCPDDLRAQCGNRDNLDLTLLPPELFIRLATELSRDWMDLESKHRPRTETATYQLTRNEPKLNPLHSESPLPTPNLKLWLAQGRFVIPPSEPLKREILYHNHGKTTTGHPGRRHQTIQRGRCTHYCWRRTKGIML